MVQTAEDQQLFIPKRASCSKDNHTTHSPVSSRDWFSTAGAGAHVKRFAASSFSLSIFVHSVLKINIFHAYYIS